MNQSLKRIILPLALIVSAMPFLLSCGTITSQPGSMTFSPDSITLQSSNTSITTQNILLNVRGNDNLPIQGTDIKLYMYLHNHVPFANSSGVVAFLDENGDPEVIESPNNSNIQGTILNRKTDTHGNITFGIQFPLGAAYSFEIIALGVRTSSTMVISVETNSSDS